MFAQLYNPKTIKKKCAQINITAKQRKAAKEWLGMLKSGKLEKEVPNYPHFMHILLRDLLGYPEKEINFESENVEFSFKDKEGNTAVCFEAKGTETKDLFARQSYKRKDQETPVIQTYTNMGRFPADYGISTNYRHFVLLDAKYGLTKCHKFDFHNIDGNEDKLKELIGIFSYQNLVLEQFLEDLFNASVTEELEFTKEFYKLYHETRLMLVKAFQEKEEVGKEEAIHYAQLYLNRLIFLFFAEDNGNISKHVFSDRILQLLKAGQCTEFTRTVSDEILHLFKALDKGSNILGVFGFNGGLFQGSIPPKIYFFDLKDPEFFSEVKQHSKLPKKIKLNPFVVKAIKQYNGKLNPIISNLLLMESFDFTTEVNVNILGHIFEQSITDLEELKGGGVSKRKKEGVYYTPEYVTDHICRNTILSYLSKNNADSVEKVVNEYADNIEDLEKRIKEIKILDPACGSGAFLIKAVEILLELDKEIQQMNPSVVDQTQLKEWSEEKEITKIIEGNIFGVDVNEESVGITKLSLFLKMSTVNRKLMDLSKNIRIGNSLVEDKLLDSNAFDWAHEFSEIFDKGGFDIVIGNPPYIPTELIKKNEKEYYSKNFEGIYRKYDTSILFVERCLQNMKKGAYLGFIMPLTWQTGDNYPRFRKLVFQKNNASLSNLVNLPFDVFPDAYVDTGIAIFRNIQNGNSFHAIEYQKNEKINSIDPRLGKRIEFSKVLKHPDLKVFPTNAAYKHSTISEEDAEFGTITESTQGIVTSKYPISDSKKSDKYLPFLLKADANRYRFQIRSKSFIDSKSIPKILHLYTQPKIMIRRIVNRQNRLMAFYEDTGIVTNKDYNPFVITSKDFDILYILALLNSRLFSYRYIKKSSLALKDDFRQTTLSEIRKFGIKRIDKNEQKKFADKAKRITKLTHEYFELKDKIFRRISDNFNIKINKKLSDLLEIDFTTFKKEIEHLIKRKLSLKEQDQWEKYLLDNTSQLKDLKNKLTSIDNELDEDVYKLYNITDSERKLVEQNVLEQRL